MTKKFLEYVRASGEVLAKEELDNAILELRARRNMLITEIIDSLNSGGNNLQILEKWTAEYNKYGKTLTALVDFANSYELPSKDDNSRE